MTSLDIAQVTGKQHKDVLRAIRAMEPAWVKECGRKFALTSQRVNMPQGGIRLIPVFALTKTECLYVATKFNDVARARLVLRWEELERERLVCSNKKEVVGGGQLLLETEDDILKRSDSIRRQQIGSENAESDGCMTTTEVAKLLRLTVKDLYALLVAAGVVFWNGGRYKLKGYQDCGYAKVRSFHYYSLEGEKKERLYLVWTEKGVDFVCNLLRKQ